MIRIIIRILIQFSVLLQIKMAEVSGDKRRILIKGGTVVNDTHMSKVDVFCEDGLIKEIGNIGNPLSSRMIVD